MSQFGLCAVSADLARYEREQDFLDESDRVRDAIEAEIRPKALQEIIWSPTLLARYFTETFSFDVMSDEEKTQVLEAVVLIWMDTPAESVCRSIKAAFAPHMDAAAETYTQDETKRLHDEWLRERGRK